MGEYPKDWENRICLTHSICLSILLYWPGFLCHIERLYPNLLVSVCISLSVRVSISYSISIWLALSVCLTVYIPLFEYLSGSLCLFECLYPHLWVSLWLSRSVLVSVSHSIRICLQYSGRNEISAPSWENTLFGFVITREPDLVLIRRFFDISLRLFSITSEIFRHTAVTVVSREALP
jgi:hypothetical protein